MGQLIVKAFLAYVEKNPAVLEEVVAALVNYLLQELKKATA